MTEDLEQKLGQITEVQDPHLEHMHELGEYVADTDLRNRICLEIAKVSSKSKKEDTENVLIELVKKGKHDVDDLPFAAKLYNMNEADAGKFIDTFCDLDNFLMAVFPTDFNRRTNNRFKYLRPALVGKIDANALAQVTTSDILRKQLPKLEKQHNITGKLKILAKGERTTDEFCKNLCVYENLYSIFRLEAGDKKGDILARKYTGRFIRACRNNDEVNAKSTIVNISGLYHKLMPKHRVIRELCSAIDDMEKGKRTPKEVYDRAMRYDQTYDFFLNILTQKGIHASNNISRVVGEEAKVKEKTHKKAQSYALATFENINRQDLKDLKEIANLLETKRLDSDIKSRRYRPSLESVMKDNFLYCDIVKDIIRSKEVNPKQILEYMVANDRADVKGPMQLYKLARSSMGLKETSSSLKNRMNLMKTTDFTKKYSRSIAGLAGWGLAYAVCHSYFDLIKNFGDMEQIQGIAQYLATTAGAGVSTACLSYYFTKEKDLSPKQCLKIAGATATAGIAVGAFIAGLEYSIYESIKKCPESFRTWPILSATANFLAGGLMGIIGGDL